MLRDRSCSWGSFTDQVVSTCWLWNLVKEHRSLHSGRFSESGEHPRSVPRAVVVHISEGFHVPCSSPAQRAARGQSPAFASWPWCPLLTITYICLPAGRPLSMCPASCWRSEQDYSGVSGHGHLPCGPALTAPSCTCSPHPLLDSLQSFKGSSLQHLFSAATEGHRCVLTLLSWPLFSIKRRAVSRFAPKRKAPRSCFLPVECSARGFCLAQGQCGSLDCLP